MAKHSQLAWAALWIAEGGRPSAALKASAIVMAESGGDDSIDNGICCVGGYQLNVRDGIATRKCAENARCSTRKAIEMSNDGRNWDPWGRVGEGAMSGVVAAGTWSRYSTGNVAREVRQLVRKVERAQRQGGRRNVGLGDIFENTELGKILGPLIEGFGKVAGEVDEQATGGAGKDILTGIPGAISEVGDVLADIGRFFVGAGELLFTPEGWRRIAKLLGGTLLLAYGLSIVAKKGFGVDNPAKKIAGAVPAGKAVKAAT